MKFQVQTQFFNFDSRGNSKQIKVGTTLSQKEYDKLTPAKQDKCSQLVTLPSGRIRYTKEEIIKIVEFYQQNDNRASVSSKFFEFFPNTQHTADSVMFQVCLLENLDNTKPGQSGSYHVTQLVVEVAHEIDPDRFYQPDIDSKLDSILDMIRG